MTPHEVLVAAAEKIADPSHWTKGAYARNALGVAIPSPSRNELVSFCMIGACNECGDDAFVAAAAINVLSKLVPGGDVISFNDDVVDVFNRAIATTAAKWP